MADPIKRHPGYEPTNPPPPIKESGGEVTIAGLSTRTLLNAASKWGPSGIGITLIVVFFALGGQKSLVEIVKVISESNGAKMQMSEDFERLSQSIERHIKLTDERLQNEQAQRDKLSAQVYCQEKHISMLCHFASQQNGGRPESDWCGARGEGLTWIAPPLDTIGGPRIRTDAQWIDCKTLLSSK